MSKPGPAPRDGRDDSARFAAQLADAVDQDVRAGFREKAEEPDQFALTFLEFIACGELHGGPDGSTAAAGFYLALAPQVRAAFRAQWPMLAPLLARIRIALRRCPEGHIQFEDALLRVLWTGMRIQQTIAAPAISSDGYCEVVGAAVRALLCDGPKEGNANHG